MSIGPAAMRTRARPLLGTLVEIGAAGAGLPALDAAIDRAFAVVQHVHACMSYHDTTSDVARLNRLGRGTTVVDAHTWRVLAAACEVSEASDGRFDVSIAPFLVRQGLLPRHPERTPPDPDAGWQHIELLEGNRVRLTRALHIDLGGIAKGHAVDCALEILQQAGLPIGRVNAGGDLRRFGEACETVHVRHPAQETRRRRGCPLRGGAIATSATYYARRLARNATVSPLIDPATRRPCTAMRSVSVMADRCVIADALTKVVFAAPDAAPGTLHRFGAHAIVLDADAAVPGSCRARASTVDGWQALSLATTEASAA
jgi:thiamine biosynthesis lipoprotein